jgi:hypothetical protein
MLKWASRWFEIVAGIFDYEFFAAKSEDHVTYVALDGRIILKRISD